MKENLSLRTLCQSSTMNRPYVLFLFTWLSVATGVTPVRVTITTSPAPLQFFKEKSVTFNCRGTNSSEWIVMRHVFLENITSKCGSNWGTRYKSNSCKITMLLPWDTGAYWCQSLTNGIASEAHNLTVSGTSTILNLDSGVPPYIGMDMTLSCLHKHDSFREPVYFYKDNAVIARCPTTSTVTIKNITKSHEGFYKCGPAGKSSSPLSWISVIANQTIVPGFTQNETRCEINTEFTVTEETPRDRGGHTDHDDLYAFLGGLLFIIILLAVSYLVFLICTVKKRRLSRKHSVTPHTRRRHTTVLLSKYENYIEALCDSTRAPAVLDKYDTCIELNSI